MGSPTSLWMGDLEPYMDENFVRDSFHQMGETVNYIKIIRNKQTGQPAGYCFVEFSSHEGAHTAMLRLNGKAIPGIVPTRRFKLNVASYGKEHMLVPEYSLFVGELDTEVDDLVLYSVFARRYKSVRAAKVVIDAEGKSRGYGFVRFTDYYDQQRALREMQNYRGSQLGDRPIRVSVATPKKPGVIATPPNDTRSTGYYPGYNSYSNYYSQYGYQYSYNYPTYAPGTTSPYAASSTDMYDTGEQQTEEQPDSDNELVDPVVEIDVEQANKEFIEKSEELYLALEGSRWHPLDNIMSPIDSKPQT